MREYLKCKSCGFVIEASRLRAVCPACGVKREMFGPDTEKLSEFRRAILDSHLHPVMVHFPQSIPVLLFIAGILILVVPPGIREDLNGAIRVLAASLPIFVAGGFIAGIFDGKVRFRRITTPILRLKIIVGVAFFVCSCAGALIPYARFEPTLHGVATFELIQFLCIACSTALGKWGASLINAKFPG